MTHQDMRRESGVRALKIGLYSFIWFTAALIMIPIMWAAAPDFEAVLAPPLTEQHVTDAHLKTDDPSFMLWRWDFFKARRGYPVFISFMAYDPKEPRFRVPVEVFVDWNCEKNFRSDRTSTQGTKSYREMCARLPHFWRGRPDIRIDGYAEYRVGHPLYAVPVRIPPRSSDWLE